MSSLNDLLPLLHPFYCSDKIRVGSDYDGGYVLPLTAIKDADLLLSFGIATNIDFEKHIARLNSDIKIMMFDPFTGPLEDFSRLMNKRFDRAPVVERVPAPQINPGYFEGKKSLPGRILERTYFWTMFYAMLLQKRYTYKKRGLRDYNDRKFINFPLLFSDPAVNNKNNILIKMDIELDEYKVWKQLQPYLSKVSLIIVEIHQVGTFYKDVIQMIGEFKASGLYVVHVHGNNVDHLIEGSLIPNCLELTFCKEEYCSPLIPDTRKYPDKDLDAPCNPNWLDYELPVGGLDGDT